MVGISPLFFCILFKYQPEHFGRTRTHARTHALTHAHIAGTHAHTHASVSRSRADGGYHRFSSPNCPQLPGLKSHLSLGATHLTGSIPGPPPMMDIAGELCGGEIKAHFEGQVEKGRPLGGGSESPKVDIQGEMPSSPTT